MNKPSNVVPLKSDDQIMDTASVWLVRLDEGLSDTQEQELKAWLEQPRHRDIFLEMAQLWDKMDTLASLGELFPAPSGNKRKVAPALAIAASVILVIFAGFGALQLSPSGPAVLQVQHVGTFESALGQHKHVVLPDGSGLWLNTNSIVDVTFTENQRLIHLKQGELHVAVAKDPTRPLSVLAGRQQIQAVGTEFNVALEDNSVELVVAEGKVKVARTDAGQNALLQANGVALPASAPLIRQGFKTQLNDTQVNPPVRVQHDEMESVLAWRTGQLIFRGEPLRAVLDEVSRYTQLQFTITDAALADIQVAGLFHTNNVDAMLASLAHNFGLKFTPKSNDKMIVTAG